MVHDPEPHENSASTQGALLHNNPRKDRMNQSKYPTNNYLDQSASIIINGEIYVSKYVSLGYRTPNSDEINTRRTARDLKIPTDEAIQIAAPAMAALIDGPCWLVPVPASDGSLTANLTLAHAIAKKVPGSHVKCAVGRACAVGSSHNRRLHGLPRLTIAQHAIIRTAGPMEPLPVYFVDNVITTGTTLAACRRALGWGTGLAYADASKLHPAKPT